MQRDYTVRYTIDTSTVPQSEAVVRGAFATMAAGAIAASGELDKIEKHFRTLATQVIVIGQAAAAVGSIGNQASTAAPQLATVLAHIQGIGAQINSLQTVAGTIQTMNVHGAQGREHFGGLLEQIVKIRLAFMGLHEGTAVLEAIGAKAKEVREELQGLGDAAAKFRQGNLELANLWGKPTADNETTARVAQFGSHAGMTMEQARTFLKRLEGSIPLALEKGNILGGPKEGESQKDYEARVRPQMLRFSEEAGKIGQRFGLDQETSADLLASIASVHRLNSPEDVQVRMGQVLEALQRGRGELGVLVPNFNRLVGEQIKEDTGAVRDVTSLAALYSTFTGHYGPGDSVTMTRRHNQALRRPDGDAAATLQQAGIDPSMDVFESAPRLFAVLDQQAKAGVAPDTALWNLGFHQEQQRRALLDAYSNRGAVDERRAIAQSVTAPQVAMANKAHWQSEAGIKQRIDSAASINQAVRGMEEEPIQMARQAAAVRLIDSNTLKGESFAFADHVASFGGRTEKWLGAPSQEKDRIDAEALRAIEQAAEGTPLAAEIRAQSRNFTGARQVSEREKAALFRNWQVQLQAMGRDWVGHLAGPAVKMQREGRTPEQQAAWDRARMPRPNPNAQPVEMPPEPGFFGKAWNAPVVSGPVGWWGRQFEFVPGLKAINQRVSNWYYGNHGEGSAIGREPSAMVPMKPENAPPLAAQGNRGPIPDNPPVGAANGGRGGQPGGAAGGEAPLAVAMLEEMKRQTGLLDDIATNGGLDGPTGPDFGPYRGA